MPAGREKTEFELSPLSAAAHSCQAQAGVAESGRESWARVGSNPSCRPTPMDCSTPGSPVLHHLPEFAQIHVH